MVSRRQTIAPPRPERTARGDGPSARASLDGLVPGLSGTDEIYLAVGIVGATVMPHVIYLHSALTKERVSLQNDAERRRVLRFERIDVMVALGLAG